MRIVCPSCAATYDVPDSLLTPGRAVRCARCSDEWMPVATTLAEPEAPPTSAEPSPSAAQESTQAPATDRLRVDVTENRRPTAMDRLAANPALSPPLYGLRVAWAASLVLLFLLACGAYTWRKDIIQAWPPSARMYAAFGLHAVTNQTR